MRKLIAAILTAVLAILAASLTVGLARALTVGLTALAGRLARLTGRLAALAGATAALAADQIANSGICVAGHGATHRVHATQAALDNIAGSVGHRSSYIASGSQKMADRAIDLAEQTNTAGSTIAAVATSVAAIAAVATSAHFFLLSLVKKRTQRMETLGRCETIATIHKCESHLFRNTGIV